MNISLDELKTRPHYVGAFRCLSSERVYAVMRDRNGTLYDFETDSNGLFLVSVHNPKIFTTENFEVIDGDLSLAIGHAQEKEGDG